MKYGQLCYIEFFYLQQGLSIIILLLDSQRPW